MLKITEDMDEVIADEDAVVYFTASRCQPCRALKPQFAKLGLSDENHNYFVVDVDSIDSSYLELYNIKSVPSIFHMNSGKVNKIIRSRTADSIYKEVSGL